MRRLLLVLVLLSLATGLVACRQVGCAWDKTRSCVCGLFERPAPAAPCAPVVLTDPVYDPVCSSQARLGAP